MKKRAKKLMLTKETVKTLPAELSNVAGGSLASSCWDTVRVCEWVPITWDGC